MSVPNAIDAYNVLPWYKLFDALTYVTNPYALLAYIFLVVIVVIGFAKIPQRQRGIFLFVLAIMVIGAIWALVDKSLDAVELRSTVHLINKAGESRAEVAPGIVVTLLDVTSLEGKAEDGEPNSGHAANRTLPENLFADVLEGADIRSFDAAAVRAMGQAEWDDYLRSLGAMKRRTVLDTPFAKLQIETGKGKSRDSRTEWWLKGVPIPIEVEGKAVTLTLTNIYNTKNQTSGENEAVNLKVSGR